MSFKGFKKAMDRAGTQLMQKAGAIEKTVDKEYDDEERRFRVLESKVEKLLKEAKGYLDAVRAMTIAQQRIADTMNQFYDEHAPLADCCLRYKDAANTLDEEVRIQLDQDYRAAVLDPLSRYVSYFPPVNDAIRRRQKKLLDYDSARSRVRKLAENPSEDVDRLPKTERQAMESRELYEQLNRQLIEDLPKLIDTRVPILDPCFEALIKCQLRFASTAYEKLAALKREFDAKGVQNLDGRVEAVLQELRDMQIAAAASGATAGS